MARPRRSRFTVTTQRHGVGVERQVILSYSGEGAADFYRRRGYVVLAVVSGDYRHQEAAQNGGWRLDRRALADAVDFLGITWPVQVKQTGARGGRYGAHGLRPSGGCATHYITVKNWLNADKAGETLWHELCHAMQAEREAAAANATTWPTIVKAWRTCEARGQGTAYLAKPIEVEARSYEAFNTEQPLAKRR